MGADATPGYSHTAYHSAVIATPAHSEGIAAEAHNASRRGPGSTHCHSTAAPTWRIQSVYGPRAGPVRGSRPVGPTEIAGLPMREEFWGTVKKSRLGSSVLQYSRPDPLSRPTHPENPPHKHCVEPICEISARCNNAQRSLFWREGLPRKTDFVVSSSLASSVSII